MTTLAIHSEAKAIALPEPRTPVAIRLAELSDIKFIDALQKKHSKMVGFAPLPQLEKNVESGHVLIASEPRPSGSGHIGMQGDAGPLPDGRGSEVPVGYCIFKDKYDKHDDCGIFYQVNIAPGKQRGLIGAALVKAALDRAAYGCKLACCWCAQDLQANKFWESLGFVPLAFRTGSRVKGRERIHIFWQRRVREADHETPYWFPAETSGGAIKENRLVLPIPPGTHWSDAKPMIVPGPPIGAALPGAEGTQALPESPRRKREKRPVAPKRSARDINSGGLWFAPPAGAKAPHEKPKRPREKPAPRKQKNDPKHIAAARELRDRYIEQINLGNVLPPSANGKYDVSRQLAPTTGPSMLNQTPLFNAA